MSNESLLITIVTALAGVVGTFITVRFKKPKPKSEYIDEAMKAYEAIIKRADTENERLRLEIDVLKTQLNTEITKRVKAERELEEVRMRYENKSEEYNNVRRSGE